jgi:pyruvate formate lyase activating enzyme
MHEALLFEKLGNSRIKCHICRWKCSIALSGLGVCRMYKNVDGILYNLNYGLASSVAIDPIEKKPLYHFYPGSKVFSLGSWGCNFHCEGCQNWQISCADVDSSGRGSQEILPAQAVQLAIENGCQGIAWTYNEPTMWFEYTLDSAKLAKKQNLYTVYVTNGYTSLEALDMIGPYLDAWRVDIKGFNDEFYRKIARITNWEGILETAETAKQKWKMHVEVITNIIPTMNSDDEQLNGIAKWIKDKLGELTPWHVTRFYPQYQATDLPYTPISTLEHAVDIGKRAGLKFVYIGNVSGHEGESTVCFKCGNLVVKRVGYRTEVLGLSGTKCSVCGTELNFRVGKSKGITQTRSAL